MYEYIKRTHIVGKGEFTGNANIFNVSQLSASYFAITMCLEVHTTLKLTSREKHENNSTNPNKGIIIERS